MNSHQVRTLGNVTVHQTVNLQPPPTPPHDANAITIGYHEKRALRKWMAALGIKRSQPEVWANMFFVTALAFQHLLHKRVIAWVQYCYAEGLEPDLKTLRKMILTSTRKKKGRK